MSDPALRKLMEAASFAARVHQGQFRKDRQTPYAAHPFRVCLVLRHVFGHDDPTMQTAALLHDTLEDTTTDHDDLSVQFGETVADWVALLTKDSRLPEDLRERDYMAALVGAPWQVQVCKLADVYDNLLDSGSLPPNRLEHTLRRVRQYLDAFHGAQDPNVLKALVVVEKQWLEIAQRLSQTPDAK
jgi:(p)ppGpp synthase/HD superfamily hydrolase